MKQTKFERLASALTHEGIRQRKIMWLGFEGYRKMVLSPDAPEIQISECRLAFFAGAKHLFDCMMHALSPGDDVSPADEEKMAAIAEEMEKFGADFVRDHIKTKGSA